MKLYTKTGDSGTTGMLNGTRVKKSDDRIELIGTLDELNSHIGLAKVTAYPEMKNYLSHIQRNIMTIMSSVSDPGNRHFRLSDEAVEELEKEIDRIENLFPRKKGFVLYGGCELSARLDVARAVARRADRRYTRVKNIYGSYGKAMAYINRLADYLYVLARYADYLSHRESGEETASRDCLKDSVEEAEHSDEKRIEAMIREALKEYHK